jgi:hypothetical protein
VVVAAGIGAAVLVVAAAVVALTGLGRGGGGREPFDEAVDRLALAPTVGYSTSVLGGALELDVDVTRDGNALGTATMAGIDLDLLVVDGTTYFRAPEGEIPGLGMDLSGSAAGSGFVGRWVTGGPVVGSMPALMTPETLAGSLRDALAGTDDFSTSDDLDREVGGTAARGVRTPAGDLYVTEQAPHDVLRFVPRGAGEGEGQQPSLPSVPSLPPMPSLPSPPPSLPSPPTTAGLVRPAAHRLQQPPTPTSEEDPDDPDDPGAEEPPAESPGFPLPEGSEPGLSPAFDQIDVDPMEEDLSMIEDLNDLHDQLVEAVEQLNEAVDARIQFSLQGNANVVCAAACTVTANVTNQVTGGAESVSATQVTAEMTASISVDGATAGACASPPTQVPVNGSSTLSCVSPEAGAQAQAALARKRAAAQASGRGGVVTVSITGSAQVAARAVTQEQVEQLVADLGVQRSMALGDACVRRGGSGGSGEAQGLVGRRAQRRDPCSAVVPLTDVVPAEDVRFFKRQGQATYAAAYVDSRRIGGRHTNRRGGHAEDLLDGSGDIDAAFDHALRQAGRGERPVVDIVVNRAPCSTTGGQSGRCIAVLTNAAVRARDRGIDLRVIVTGAYTAGGSIDEATTVRWITEMRRYGAEVLVGVPPDGMLRNGALLAEALRRTGDQGDQGD